MNKVNKSAIIDYSATQMYQLVNDIKNYPQFLPMCYDIKIFKQTETETEALLKIKSGFIKIDFTTKNIMKKNESIQLNLLNGPFKSLTGDWKFEAKSNKSCKISLNMQFIFENKFVEMALGTVFYGLADKMLEAFCKRAKEVYK